MQSSDSVNHVPRCGTRGIDNAEKIAYGMDRYSWNQGYNALYDFQVFENVEPALVARGGQRSAVTERSDLLLYQKVISSLNATDYKWVQQQQVVENKLIICKRR